MSLKHVHTLIDEYALWRGTELVAKQDVEDAEYRVVAADLRLQEARAALKAVTGKLGAIEDEIADAIEAHTAPTAMLYLTDEA